MSKPRPGNHRNRPYCYECGASAKPYTHMAPCSHCGAEDAEEVESWKPTCNCGSGLVWPDVADKMKPYDAQAMPLYVLVEKLQCDSE